MNEQTIAIAILAVFAGGGLGMLAMLGMDSPTGDYVYWSTYRRADGGAYRHYSREIHTVTNQQPLDYGYMHQGGRYYTYVDGQPVRYEYKTIQRNLANVSRQYQDRIGDYQYARVPRN